MGGKTPELGFEPPTFGRSHRSSTERSLLLYCYSLGFSLEGRREADERGCEDCTIKMMNGWLVLFEAAKAAERETRMRNEKKSYSFCHLSHMTRLQEIFDAPNGVICLL